MLDSPVVLHTSHAPSLNPNAPLCGRQFKARLEELVRTAASHPKMAALLEVVLEHFREAAAGNPGADPGSGAADGAGGAPGAAAAAVSRVIVFTNLRDSVASICALLERHAPLVTAKCAPNLFLSNARWQQPRSANAAFAGAHTWCMLPHQSLQTRLKKCTATHTLLLHHKEDWRPHQYLFNDVLLRM